MFIALDIETTGFDPEKDSPMEIAFVRFDAKHIFDEWTTLVNPETEIPAIVSHITGIAYQDILHAPKLSEVQASIQDRIGTYPIVGHNVSFDIEFLKKKNFRIENPVYDTYSLSTILIPGLPSYALEALTPILKIPHAEKHRALQDARAAMHLFRLLLQRIETIAPDVRTLLADFLHKTSWPLKTLFLS